jgi:uncharacterized protein YaeQ
MRLNCTIQDGVVWLADDSGSIEIHPEMLKSANGVSR